MIIDYYLCYLCYLCYLHYLCYLCYLYYLCYLCYIDISTTQLHILLREIASPYESDAQAEDFQRIVPGPVLISQDPSEHVVRVSTWKQRRPFPDQYRGHRRLRRVDRNANKSTELPGRRQPKRNRLDGRSGRVGGRRDL